MGQVRLLRSSTFPAQGEEKKISFSRARKFNTINSSIIQASQGKKEGRGRKDKTRKQSRAAYRQW